MTNPGREVLATIEDAAIAAMDRGWKVFPVRGKVPATLNGLHDASGDVSKVHGWWGLNEDRGMALATGDPSGVWALDLDGPEGEAAIRALQQEPGGLPTTTASRTRNGYHLLFQMPEDREIRNSAGKVAPGVDVRGTGGYIVLPPSPHPEAGHYEWIRPPADVPPADPPEWLVEQVTAPTDENGRPKPADPLPETIPQGQRNETLASLAGTMRRRGATPEAMRAALREENRARCAPPLPEEEVEEIAISISRYAPTAGDRENAATSGASGAVEGEGWREPIPLGPEPPADLPSGVLPPPLRKHVESVAAFTQTPTGLPLTVGLAAAATTIAGKMEVEVRRGWREPVNLYGAVVLDPANRKSPVEREMVAPLREYEREGAEKIGPEHRAALDKKKALEKRLSRAQKAVAKATSAEEEGQALSDLEEDRRRIEELEVPTPPRLLTDDVTPEALGRIMHENAGRASIISSEGDVLRIFAGRYSSTGDPTLDIIKKAWSGDPVRVDRVGRDGAHLPRPLLTVGLTVQPTLLRTLGNREVLDGEGVLARFLWMAPPSLIGDRLTGADVPAPDEEAREGYERLLRTLLDLEPADVDEAGEWRPHVLELTPDARVLLYAWESEVEGLLADGGQLAPIRSWGGKLVGTTVRLAGVLHVVERAGRGSPPFAAPVSATAMTRAVRLARAFVPHARHVLAGEVGMDERIKLARYVLRRTREADDVELTERDLWQLTRGKAEINEMEDLRDVLQTLEAHRLVRTVPRESTGGRRPSPWVRLNPRARENTPKSPTSPHHEDRTPTSGSFGDTDRGVPEETDPSDPDPDTLQSDLGASLEGGS